MMLIYKLLFTILSVFIFNCFYTISEEWKPLKPFHSYFSDIIEYDYIFHAKVINDSTFLAVLSDQLDGRYFNIRKTTNKGIDWEVVYVDTLGYIGKDPTFSYVSDDICYLSADPGVILKSTDGGNSWLKNVYSTDSIYGLSIKKYPYGILHVRKKNEFNNYDYYLTDNGGKSWNYFDIPFNFKERTRLIAISIYSIDLALGSYISEDNKTFFINIKDSLRSWSEYESPELLLNYSIIDGINCYGIGIGERNGEKLRQKLYYSDDRCQSWKTILDTIWHNAQLFQIKFFDKNNGIVSGIPNIILRTSNGGKSWIRDMLKGHQYEVNNISNNINFDLYTFHNSCIALGNKKGVIDTLYILDLANTNNLRSNIKYDCRIHPNPATSEITLSLGEEFISAPQIDIIDYLGNAMKMDYEINGSEITINTSTLSPGVYFLRIRSGGQVETRKFVVVR